MVADGPLAVTIGNKGRHVGGEIGLFLSGYVLFCQEFLALKGTGHPRALKNIDLGHPVVSLYISFRQSRLSKHVLSGLGLDWSVSLCPTLQIGPIPLVYLLHLSSFLYIAHIEQYLMLVHQIPEISRQAHLHTLGQIRHIFYKTRQR
jgi:hypothetical protein